MSIPDAIQEIDVGMEGHGSWRSQSTACTPGVHYRRGAVICVCDEDGSWPNPVCRDLFRVLHAVELVGQIRPNRNDSCTPTKLYLVGCNVCFCPSTGYLDPDMCTKRECQEDDPVLEETQTPALNIPPNDDDAEHSEDLEIYATCDPNYNYELGCRNCDCIRNNRLLCGYCSVTRDRNSLSERSKEKRPNKPRKQPKTIPSKYNKSICHGKKQFKVFKMGCNLCHCGLHLKLYCTIRKCLDKDRKPELLFQNANGKPRKPYKEVSEPADEASCTPGTTFKKECNFCWCAQSLDGVKYIACTKKRCFSQKDVEKWGHPKIIEGQKMDCAVGTMHQQNCMICYCYMKNNVKYQECRLTKRCLGKIGAPNGLTTLQGTILEGIESLHGVCEPYRRYKSDCNTCRCLPDAKTVECTSRVCSLRSSGVSVDIVPMVVEDGENCPKGHSYKLGCNLCFCLSNGNAICTTDDCSKNNKVYTY